MSQRPRVLDVYLPEIVGGLILAAIFLVAGTAMLPDVFRELFPKQTFVALSLAIGGASAFGLLSLFCKSQKNETDSEQHGSSNPKSKNGLSSGGNDVL